MNDIVEAVEKSFPPVSFRWISNNVNDLEDFNRLVFDDSRVTLFNVIRRKKNLGWFGPVRYEFEVSSWLRWPHSGLRIGDYANTLEEAKAKAERFATIILRGHDYVNPQTDKEMLPGDNKNEEPVLDRG